MAILEEESNIRNTKRVDKEDKMIEFIFVKNYLNLKNIKVKRGFCLKISKNTMFKHLKSI